MPTYLNPQAWSTTAASNDGADSGFGTIADTSYPRPVLDWYRGDMAALKRFAGDAGGALVAGGSADALTVTTNQNLSAAQIAAGMMLVVRAAEANTSATVTFSPDGLTAAAIKTADGTALAVGQIKAGMPLLLFYNAGSSEWRAANLVTTGGSGDLGSTSGSFRAIKGQQNIEGLSSVKLTFPIEIFDNGNLYSTSLSRWTPPAGKVLVSAGADFNSDITSTRLSCLSIYKNGSEYKTARDIASVENTYVSLYVIDSASGSDYYEVYAREFTAQAIEDEGAWFAGTVV